MKLSLKAGTTSKSVAIFIQNSSSTTGAGLTGLVYNTSSLVAYYVQPGSSAAAITLATLAAANSAWSSGGFKEVDSTNMPGIYRLDIPDAVLTGATSVVIMLKGATNMAPCVLEIELTAWNNQDTVRGGLTALPNAAAEASGGLYTRGTGAGQINQANNGQIDTNVIRVGGTSQTARDIGASVLLSSGTGTGQISLSSGLVDITQTAADKAWSTTSRVLTAGTNIQLPSNGLANVTAWTVAITGNITGNLSGSVGSVTGLTASNLDATISSRLASASYTAPDNTTIAAIATYVDTEVAAIKAKTDNLPASPAATGDAMTLTAAYDAAKTAAQAGDQMDLVNAPNATAVTAIQNGLATASALSTTDGKADAIKAKTDSLTFTVAGMADANIQYVNDVQVTGDGQTGTEWGPA